MSASSIQAKVRAGLAKANMATGSSTSLPIYLVAKTQSGTPLTPSVAETLTLLPNAIFKSYDKGLTDISIQTGDRQLVSDSSTPVKQGDTIRQGSSDYVVVSVDDKSPVFEPLVYVSQVRLQ